MSNIISSSMQRTISSMFPPHLTLIHPPSFLSSFISLSDWGWLGFPLDGGFGHPLGRTRALSPWQLPAFVIGYASCTSQCRGFTCPGVCGIPLCCNTTSQISCRTTSVGQWLNKDTYKHLWILITYYVYVSNNNWIWKKIIQCLGNNIKCVCASSHWRKMVPNPSYDAH